MLGHSAIGQEPIGGLESQSSSAVVISNVSRFTALIAVSFFAEAEHYCVPIQCAVGQEVTTSDVQPQRLKQVSIPWIEEEQAPVILQTPNRRVSVSIQPQRTEKTRIAWIEEAEDPAYVAPYPRRVAAEAVGQTPQRLSSPVIQWFGDPEFVGVIPVDSAIVREAVEPTSATTQRTITATYWQESPADEYQFPAQPPRRAVAEVVAQTIQRALRSAVYYGFDEPEFFFAKTSLIRPIEILTLGTHGLVIADDWGEEQWIYTPKNPRRAAYPEAVISPQRATYKAPVWDYDEQDQSAYIAPVNRHAASDYVYVPVARLSAIDVRLVQYESAWEYTYIDHAALMYMHRPHEGTAPPVVDDSATSGGWVMFDHFDHQRRERRKKQIEQEEAEEALQSEIDRSIAQLLHKQEQEEDQRKEFERIKLLVAKYADTTDVGSDRVNLAIQEAKAKQTKASLEKLQREFLRMMEEEEMAVMLTLAMID